MRNIANLMKQAQEMQQRMAQLQESLADHEVTGTAGAGMVEVRLNVRGEMRGVRIDPSLIVPDEAEVLEDLIIAAHNDAKAKADARSAEEIRRLSGGLELPPGFKLPF